MAETVKTKTNYVALTSGLILGIPPSRIGIGCGVLYVPWTAFDERLLSS